MAVNRNLVVDYEALLEQLPVEWRTHCVELFGAAAGMFANIREYNLTLEGIQQLEGMVRANVPQDTATVMSVLEKCKSMADSVKNAVKDFVCQDRTSCANNMEKMWENQILKQINKEKTQAANNCVKAQAIVSAIIIVVEFHALHSVWTDIETAENIVKISKERDIPLIQEWINRLQIDQAKLRNLIEENIRGGNAMNSTLLSNMRAVTFSLMLDLMVTRNMISDVKFQLNEQIVCIGRQRKDAIRRGISNTAQACGAGIQLILLAANISSPWALLQMAITTTFGALAVGNAVAYKICTKKLMKLRETMLLIQDMEYLVSETEQVIRQAEAMYMNV